MSLSLAQALSGLALGQALIVVPPLGESYAGKSAAVIAAMLMMLAHDLETLPDRRVEQRQRLTDILGRTNVDDPALARDIALLLGTLPGLAVGAIDARLLAAFTEVHAWADRNDPVLAGECRQFLVDWTESERLYPPALTPG
jgi:hypothetical protein